MRGRRRHDWVPVGLVAGFCVLAVGLWITRVIEGQVVFGMVGITLALLAAWQWHAGARR